VAENPEAEKTAKPAAQRPARRWATRAEAIAALLLACVFVVWVAVIIVQQRRNGNEIRWTPEKAAAAVYLVDLNHADPAELVLLPGVGAAKAEWIVNWRKEHGPFRSLEEVRKAGSLSANELSAIKGKVTLGEEEPAPQAGMDYDTPESE